MTDLSARLAALSPEQRAAFEKLLKQKAGATRANRDAIARRAGPPALSFGQERLWFLHRLDPDDASYNVHTVLDIPSVAVDVVRRALSALHERHEILRSTFVEIEGRPSIVINADATPDVTFASVRDQSELQRHEALSLLAQEESLKTFDLASGPTARYRLVDMGADEHALIVTMHHIVTDARSIDVFHRELIELCEAFAEGRPSRLAPLPLQYADFAVWQRERLSGARLDQELAFWTAKLDGAPVALDLPTDHPRRPDHSTDGASQSIDLSPISSMALRELGRQRGATPFMTLLAAFAVLLHRHCGQTDILIGMPVSGRTREELEGLIGFFIDTVVVRVDLSGDPAFVDLLNRVKLSVTEALSHQELPFERLVSALVPGRHTSRAPLFQVMAQWLPDGALADSDEGDQPTESGEVAYGPAQFELSVDFSDSASGIRALFQYSTELFENSTITQMLRRFCQLIDLAVESPTRRLSELSILLPSEHRLVSETWQARRVVSTQAQDPLAAIADVARRHPARIALEGADGSLSYDELEQRSNQVAHAIARAGVRPGDVVAVCCAPSADVVVGILGILKCGAAYLPIDHKTPADRIRFCLVDARVSALVTQDGLSPRVPFDGPRIVMDDPAAEWRHGPRTSLGIAPGIDDLAYVLYTSGSTGRPKGVKISHRSLATFLYAARSRYGVTATDRVLQFASIAFDVSVEEFFMTLTLGATLVIRRDPALASVERFLADVAEHGVTVLDVPTAFWHQLVSTLARRRVSLPSCVRIVIIGGERVLPERLREWADVVSGDVRLLQGYGPTETTVVVTIADLSRASDMPLRGGQVSIGRPVPGTRVYVVDGYGQLVPPGVIGEALIGGECVSAGYMNRADIDARTFLPDPFEPGGRVFRTGDRLRWWPDGELTFHGRVDEQVKIRGFRVEPAEVESALAEHPNVRACAVVVEPDPSGSSRLAAFVEPHVNATIPREGLRRHLAERLPAFMIPWRFTILQALPMTVTGKVDRLRLASEPAEGSDQDDYQEPRTPIECEAAAIWAAALHVNTVGLAANFFDLGGHSLLAVEVTSMINERLGVDLPVRVLFEQPTLGDLARHIQHVLDEGASEDQAPPLEPQPRELYRAAWDSDGSLRIPDSLREHLRRLAKGTSFAEI